MPDTQTTFDRYADYYDLLYAGKDYMAEVNYVHNHIQRLHPEAKRLLDLGCGTGIHLSGFLNNGYEVVGVDQSDQMLALARRRLHALPDNALPDNALLDNALLDNALLDNALPDSALLQGDIRSLRLDQKFDVVVSLFHVMSYQVEEQDIARVFETARKLLDRGGLFLFDCWYGPGVLTDLPSIREKRFENDRIEVKRRSIPQMHTERNVVDVHFDVEVSDKSTGETERLNELHSMRYLFSHEIENAFAATGFDMVIAEEWLSGNELSEHSWNGFFGGRAK